MWRNRIAVDAVLAIVEQDDYPSNDRGQILLPSYDFFQQCVQVFEDEGRAVPTSTTSSSPSASSRRKAW